MSRGSWDTERFSNLTCSGCTTRNDQTETRTQIWPCNLRSNRGATLQPLGSICLSWGTHREWDQKPTAWGLHDQELYPRAAQAAEKLKGTCLPGELPWRRGIWNGSFKELLLLKLLFLPWFPQTDFMFPEAETRFCSSFILDTWLKKCSIQLNWYQNGSLMF